jgi:Glycosyl transferase 4-like domain/Glycosyl transferases group 1
MRHVLMICYDFPTIYAAGVIRTYQLAKNLPEFGWQPVILTAQECVNREDNIETSDGTLRCPKITAAGSRFLIPSRTDQRPSRRSLEPQMPNGDGPLRALIRFATQLALPDGKIGWLYPAVKRGLQIARLYPIQMCFSVSPRPTAHLVAYRLARRLNVPWVADFALPWSDAPWLADRPRFIRWLDQRVEGLIVRSAQHISVAYADLARSISARYGHSRVNKMAVIPTGFDDDLFSEPSASPAPKFRVVYPGNHFCEEGRDGEYFLKAIDEWIDFDPRLTEQVEFVFIGKPDDALLRHCAVMRHPEVIRVKPLISHRACIQAIRSSHLCVVNTVGNRIPAKVYECMRAGKPTLALTRPGSDLAMIIHRYSKGVAVPAKNTCAIRQALQNIWQLNRTGTVESIKMDESPSLYSAKHSAELLALVFDRLSQR